MPLRVLSALLAAAALVILVRWADASGRDSAGPKSEDVGEDVNAETMLVQLHEENQRLVGEVSNLTQKVIALELKLAEARVSADETAVERAVGNGAAAMPPGDVAADPGRLQVVEIDRQMQVAVVNGGARAGMKPGMLFSVVRKDEVIATIRLTEVRERIAGGLVEWNGKTAFPEAGDRLVLRTTQDG